MKCPKGFGKQKWLGVGQERRWSRLHGKEYVCSLKHFLGVQKSPIEIYYLVQSPYTGTAEYIIHILTAW